MTITKNFALHHKAIYRDVDEINAEIAARNFFAAGFDSADFMTLLLGPVQ